MNKLTSDQYLHTNANYNITIERLKHTLRTECPADSNHHKYCVPIKSGCVKPCSTINRQPGCRP